MFTFENWLFYGATMTGVVIAVSVYMARGYDR